MHARIRNGFILPKQQSRFAQNTYYVQQALNGQAHMGGYTLEDWINLQNALEEDLGPADYEYSYDYYEEIDSNFSISGLNNDGTCEIINPAPKWDNNHTHTDCSSSYPPVNGNFLKKLSNSDYFVGKCRNEHNDGAALTAYKRLVPPDYCQKPGRTDQPRCRRGN